MSAAELLGLIAAAVLLQVIVGIAVSVWRRRGAPRPFPADASGDARAGAGAAWSGWREFRVASRVFEDSAKTQCSFYLQPVDGRPLPTFRPGQFLTFSLDVAAEAEAPSSATRTITRCDSLSDRPDPSHYRVTVKRVSAPAAHPEFAPGLSSNHFHDHVQAGDLLRVKAPAGGFFIDPDAEVAAVLIAGGIGITPLMSMLRWCIVQQPLRKVHLYYGLRHTGEMAFRPLLVELAAAHPALRFNIVCSRPEAAEVCGRDYQHEGHIDVGLLQRTLPPGRHQFYVCGPPPMMQTLVPALSAWGVPPADLHCEAFGPASVKLPAGNEAAAPAIGGVEVRFRRSGRTLNWEGQDASLLDFAERHGIAVESGCRAGSCGSCETLLVEGSVRYDHAPDHEVAAGHCLLCVGRPSSALVLEA